VSREEILATLKDVAVEVLGVEADAVIETASFKDDLEADSLDLVEVVMALEEKFDISIPEDDLADVGTVGQAVDIVLDRVSASA
jgi:acyl carrier protein